MDWDIEALMALRALAAVVLGVLTALIVFGLLALHHLPTWHKIKGESS